MRRVIVESPYSGNIERNIRYARFCLLDCLGRGESPIASHLLYPQILNEDCPADRELGIEAGLAWLEVADLHVFYADHGWSRGMLLARTRSEKLGKPIEIRSLYLPDGAFDVEAVQDHS